MMEGYADVLEAAAFLHDIGYVLALKATGFHPLDGARYLRDETDAPPLLCMLVANHTCALIEASERGLQGALAEEFPIGLPPEPDLVAAITYCDLSVGPSGRSTTADERITEILTRYGDHDLVHKAINYAAPALREQYARVDSARAGVGTYGQAP